MADYHGLFWINHPPRACTQWVAVRVGSAVNVLVAIAEHPATDHEPPLDFLPMGLVRAEGTNFCSALLQQLGFQSLTVTRRSGDGGIDGHGDFRQGAVSLKSAFQAKRWTDNAVGRPEIDRFRGAIQGEFDHGVFITTSRFARQAIEASYRKGAITILLLDGDAVVELMVERGIGVTRQPVYLHEIDAAFFSFDES